MDHKHETTIPSRLMPDDFFEADKKLSSDIHPVFKLILGGIILIVILLLLRLIKA